VERATVQVENIGPEGPDLESSSEAYAQRFAGPAGEYLLDVQTRIVLEMLRSWPGARVLDVGGGHAQTAVPLSAAGYEVTVLASSRAALARLHCRAPHVQMATGDLCDPPFEAHSFDVALALRMMSHVSSWRRLLVGLCRVAKHAVVVDFPTPLSANALSPLLFGAKKGLEGDTRRYAMMRRREVRRQLAAHGFGDVVERPQFFWPMVLHRALQRPEVSRGLEAWVQRVGLTALLGSPVIIRATRMGEP
jgi:SAM-dependent methyltransferase